MMILSALLVVLGYFGVRFGGPAWLAAALCGVPLVLYLLHDLGVLAWRDDFQREVALRSGMHALIVVGLVSAWVTATANVWELAARDSSPGDGMTWQAAMTLRIAVIAWGTSWLIQYWGGQAGSIRILWVLLGLSFVDKLVTAFRVHEAPADVATLIARFGWYPLAALGIIGCRRWPRGGGAALGIGLLAWAWFASHVLAGSGLLGDTSFQLDAIAKSMPLLVPALALLSTRHRRFAE